MLDYIKDKLIGFVVFCVMFTILGIFAYALFTASSTPDPITSDNLSYQIVEVEGMTCLVVRSKTTYSYYVNSITCNWDEYDK